ncbi:hypothetical protein GOP47_0026703 [Adiantum capillus-veneris]|nr:hypothetical protein GOP47_0026703 [Adiantum capillus-veneris]
MQQFDNPSQQYPPPLHDVFLSHSGAQKGFVTDLYDELKSCRFCPFFDAKYDSLPLAQSFPQHILAAASTCKLALVILSDEYLSSKWPMLELCWCMDATPKVKILPVFFHLSPDDLKEESNKRKWLSKWETFAESDPRIIVSEWEGALKSLCSIRGIIYEGVAKKGEQSFIEEIVHSICKSQIVFPQSINDTASYMQGGDHLLQIILDQFEEMESGKHEPLGAPSTSSISPQIGIASILGIYGLPGSGKSTLCRRLQDYFFPHYPGKCLYLELPSNPTPPDMINQIGLSFGLSTSSVAHIDQVMSLLKNHSLARKSIFLVVDNICDKSCEVAQRVLHSVIGPGSKVVVVARTLDLLNLALFSLRVGHEGLNCICESIRMPTMNEEEASNLLIMKAMGCTDNKGPHQLDLMKQKDTVLTVLRKCGFQSREYSNSGFEYLPLVVERMGVMLARYEDDVDGWARGQEKIWCSFDDDDLKGYRESAVHELIWESFKDSLGSELQLLFLDMVLFLQPSRVWAFHEACSILGSMDGKDVAHIRKKLKDLKRLCFIDIVGQRGDIFVHDVYVEFAKILQKEGWFHWSYTQSEDIQWDAMTLEMKLEESAQRPVRAITLEVKEGCERIELQGLSSLKALVLRSCGSLVALRMVGLTSLAILEITGFRVFPRLECYDCDLHASVRNVKWLSLKSKRGNHLGNVMSKPQGCRSVVPAYLGSSIINTLLRRMHYVPAFVKKPSSLDLAKHMKGLQVFHLEGTGVRNLEDMGNCSWPHLQELRVVEPSLQAFRLGILPALKTFYFHTPRVYYFKRFTSAPPSSELLVEGKDLLKGCPALQYMDVASDLIKNVELMKSSWRGVQKVRLKCPKSFMELGDAIASSAQTLKDLDIRGCDTIERVNISAGQLPSLTRLYISNCQGLVEVKFGLHALPNLTTLYIFNCQGLVEVKFGLHALPSLTNLDIYYCQKLVEVKFGLQALPSLTQLSVVLVSEMCVLTGLEELMLLQDLKVECCSMLQPTSCSLRGLVHLKCLKLRQWPRAWKLHRALDFKGAGFEGLSNLKQLRIAAADISGRMSPLNLASLTNLVELETDGTLLLEGLHSLQRLEVLHITGKSRPYGTLGDTSYVEPEGILHLDIFPEKQLRTLRVEHLHHHRLLDGIECLTHVQDLYLYDCPLLEELPSLHALQEMRSLEIRECANLKAVQGCDELRKLETAVFRECPRMEQLPFKDIYALGCTHPLLRHLDFSGCGFAMDTRRELLLEWPGRTSILLGEALVTQLIWELRAPFTPKRMKKMEIEEAIVSCLLSLVTLFPNDLYLYLDHPQISEAWRILEERALAGKLKLKKDFLHTMRPRLSMIVYEKLVQLSGGN